MSRMGWIRLAVVVAGCACVVGFAESTAVAAGRCLNEQFRTGRSASLPDCRAYELVTPPELGRTSDIAFQKSIDTYLVSGDGDHMAFGAQGVFFEPGVSTHGTFAVFSRTSAGWAMKSLTAPGMAGEWVIPELFSPDLSQVAFFSYSSLTKESATFEVGPVGGSYSTLTSVPGTGSVTGANLTVFGGANVGTPRVPALSDVVIRSEDHALLPPGAEREVAEGTEPGLNDLYEWTGGRLRLVNVDSEGKLLNPCGAKLGYGVELGNAVDAVSADGSKVFFTSPEQERVGCPEPALYMRVDGVETVDVSEPQGVSVAPSERAQVIYDGASAEGSKVFFTTATDLTPAAEAAPSGYKLYEYDTEAPVGGRLTLIATGVEGERQEINPGVVVSEDGSAVYYEAGQGIFRYETAAGRTSFVAVPSQTTKANEPSYATPDGGFFLFAAGGGGELGGVEVAGPHGFPEIEPEPRGVGHEELYRYDASDGGVMCV